MSRRLRLLRRPLAVLLAGAGALHGHEEWNNLHIVYSARSSFTYPFDGRSPKIAVALLNHHLIPASPTLFTFTVNGQRPDAPGFMTFPNGGSIVIAPDDYGLASALTRGVYDGRAGPAPAVGETKDYTFQFVFALAPGAVPPPGAGAPTNPDPANNNDPPGTTTATVRFTNLGENPTLNGPLPLNGTVRLAAPPANPPDLQVEVATPYSTWFRVTATSANAAGIVSFSQALPARDDWLVRFRADGYETRVIPVGFVNDPHDPLDVTLTRSPALDLDYRRIASVATPTGFWRGAVSETEGTFVAFPGQETWRVSATDADARALRTASRIYKYSFAGRRLWEHAPGWETWAGDQSADGRFVAYALNPTAQSFYTPTENKLVLLDGATGSVIWSRSAAPTDAAVGRRIDALELTISPDARWIAVGSVAGGTVTLVDRATGSFAWTVPGTAPSFGQVRRLRFSADAQFLYVGSGDSTVRKLRVADGSVMWRAFAGGWPSVNGLDLTPDGAWLVAGTQSLDTTLLRASDGAILWQRETQATDAAFSPDGRHVVTSAGQVHRTVDGSLAGLTAAKTATHFTPDGRHLLQVDRELRLHDLGGNVLKVFEPTGLPALSGESTPWSHVTRDGRHVLLLARDLAAPGQTGIVFYERTASTPASAPPTLSAQPLAQAVVAGGTATLNAGVDGPGPFSYQWRRDGVPLDRAAARNSPFVLTGATAADAGSYTCIITNAAGSVTTNPAILRVVAPDPSNPSRLANLAVRASVGPGVPLIVGFSVGGAGTAGTKPLLIRGAGPSLAALGVGGALADPQLALFDRGTEVARNENWSGDAQVASLATRLGAFPFSAPGSRDAALVATAVAGSYTAQITSADGTTGTALAEIYDGSPAFSASTPRLLNVSARTEIGGGNLLIAGFVVTGQAARTVLIRGIGPALAGFGVRNALPDPQLTLLRDGVLVATNEDWYDVANALALIAAATQVGAFALPPASRDAALLLSLPPGSYTVQVGAGAAGSSTGSALIEVYEVP